MGTNGRQRGWTVLGVLVLASASVGQANTVLSDFDADTVGSYNPRGGWTAFGAGTTDRGITADGAVGRAAFHSVNWDQSSWGIGNKEAFRDIAGYTGIQVDARVVSGSGHTGTPLLRFALNVGNGSEWSTPTVPLTGTFATYVFAFDTLTLRSGSGTLDLTDAQPKFIVEKNAQGGSARFDFDEVILLSSAGDAYVLSPVTLQPPPDGDAIRAAWFYAGSIFDSSAASQALLDFCAREGVNRLYCGGYSVWTLGNPTQKENMRTFIATAHASGIRVEAMFGDTDWQEDATKVRTKIDQVLAMHTATPGDPTDDFDAVHFDVEFWLDDSWSAAGSEAGRRQIAIDYLDNCLVNARQHLDSSGAAAVDITVDLSAHLENSDKLPNPFAYGGTTQSFLGHVFDLVDDVVIMSYIDYAGGLWNWTHFELDVAAAKGRTIQLGADIEPVPPALPINTFADDPPSGYAAMTAELEAFHEMLSASQLAALDGFTVFQYNGYGPAVPNPHNLADVDGDADADAADFAACAAELLGPAAPVTGLARDCDLDRDGRVDLRDFAWFCRCQTGSGVVGPVPAGCAR